MITIYIANINDFKSEYDAMFSALTSVQKERVLKKKVYEDRLRSVIGLALTNQFTAKEELKYSEHGKPYKEGGPYFNVSNKGDYVVFAVADREVGVDVEKIVPVRQRLIDYALSEEERARAVSDLDFYRMWTAKESLVKCIGTGIDRNVREISALPVDGVKEFEGRYYQSFSREYDGYVISCTVEADNGKEKNSMAEDARYFVYHIGGVFLLTDDAVCAPVR